MANEQEIPIIPEADRAEWETLKAQHVELEARIQKLQPHDAVLDAMGGWVGGSGPSKLIAARNRRRERYLDRSIDAAIKIVPLLRERDHIAHRISLIETGVLQRRRDKSANAEAYVRSRKPGDILPDPIFGDCTVIRLNVNTISLRTPGGNIERRPYTFWKTI